MFTLAIDTSTNTARVVLLERETTRAEIIINSGINHSASLLPSISHIFKMAGITMDAVDLFACTVGPGSFTGLRIGASTIKGFAVATGKPVVGVSTLDALAFNMLNSSMTICPMLDAKKKQVYTAIYRSGHNNGLEKIGVEKAVEVEKFLLDIHEDCVFLGDGALVYQDVIKKMLPRNSFFTSPMNQHVRAAAVGLLGIRKFQANDTLNPFEFAPQYLRMSEAEVKADKK